VFPCSRKAAPRITRGAPDPASSSVSTLLLQVLGTGFAPIPSAARTCFRCDRITYVDAMRGKAFMLLVIGRHTCMRWHALQELAEEHSNARKVHGARSRHPVMLHQASQGRLPDIDGDQPDSMDAAFAPTAGGGGTPLFQ
jgi:hypothetical protein